MFSKKSLQISLVFVLLIGLAAIGIVYGAWTDSLAIGGNVTTGSLDVVFVPGGPVPEVDPLNLAACTLVYGDDVVTVNVTGAYPGYQCNPQITIKNLGTVTADVALNLPAASLPDGIYVGGVTFPLTAHLVQNADFSFTFPIEVYSDATIVPPMGQAYSFSYTILATQATVQ